MIQENVPISSLTYYKIGGPARYFTRPESVEDLKEAAEFLRKNKIPYFVLGAGSNVLIDDRGFDGLVIHTSKLDRTLEQQGDTLTAGASVMVIHLLRHCMNAGVSGFEFLVGIPGNMGGVIFMNAGTKLGCAGPMLLEVDAFDLATETKRTVMKDEIKFSYRAQHFLKPDELVLRGRFQCASADPKSVQDQIQKLLSDRKASQPIDKPSCGSVFKNPDPEHGVHAWKVIDQVGLRGHRIGNAQISPMHSNFIVNLGSASSSDVQALITEAKTRVKAQLGIELEEEVRLVPFSGTRWLGGVVG